MSCISSLKKEGKETADIPAPIVYIPSFPEPKELTIIPLDYTMQKVNDNSTPIGYVLLPYWYWQLIIDYGIDVESAAQVLNEYYLNATEYEGVKQPP